MNESVVYLDNLQRLRIAMYQIIKRVIDIVVGLVGIIFFIPLLIIIKLAYMFTGDFERVLFTQDRIGKHGKLFKFYKFRSMVPNADKILDDLLKKDKKLREEYRINKKLKNDPRITKIGKFIRKTSLDEIPQVINILLGDMSIVGNRPYLPREKEDMGEYFDEIVSTKPGLTGYWQVSGRSDTTFEYRLKCEKYYSSHFGLGIDARIFFKTFKVVLGHTGAK